jgi:hypothetical protein
MEKEININTVIEFFIFAHMVTLPVKMKTGMLKNSNSPRDEISHEVIFERVNHLSLLSTAYKIIVIL